MLEDGTGVAAVNHRLVVLHFFAKGSGGLSCQTDDGIAVGPVIGNLKVHDGVVIADDQIDVLAHDAAFVI